MKITNEYTEFNTRYNDFFKHQLVIDLLDDVFSYVTHEIILGFFHEFDDSDIIEMLALNIGEYVKEDLLSVNDKEKIEDDGYTFIYQNSDFIVSYINKLKNFIKSNFISNGLMLKWNENCDVKIDRIGNDIYLKIINEHIVKYTDENDTSILNKKILFKYINIEHIYILFINAINNVNLNNDFYIITECYFSDKKNTYQNYSIIKDEQNKLDKNTVESFLPLIEESIKNNHFYGWVKNTRTLKVGNE